MSYTNDEGIHPPKVAPQEIRISCPHQQLGQTLLTGCFGTLLKMAFYLFVFFLLLAFMFSMRGGSGVPGEISEKHFSGNKTAKDKIAIITINGIIYGGEETGFIKQIEKATEDSKVKAVVLRIDSPGGTVSGSDYYHHKLLEFKKKRGIPIVVSMGDMATSGGYYLAVTGDEIIAEHSTITGSIGVIMPNYDLSELCEKIGVQSDPIVSGPLKELGSVTRKLTDKERAVLESVIRDMFSRFKEIVCDGRPALRNDPELLAEVTTGQIFLAKQALEKQLIDRIGYLGDAVERAAALAGLPQDKYQAVRYEQPKTLLETMVGVKADKIAGADSQVAVAAEMLNDIAAPKMYYIYPRALPIRE
ncbi:MAG: signal peptide peptidase SppA [Planctomycetaceae bacterium]|nr:signal peptide peptidase SppA [Planctomycetaceae bacterium]